MSDVQNLGKGGSPQVGRCECEVNEEYAGDRRIRVVRSHGANGGRDGLWWWRR